MFSTRSLRQNLTLFTSTRLILNTSIRMVYPFIAVFAASLSTDVAKISLALAASMATSALGPFIAPIADRRGRKIGMLIGLGIFLAGNLAVSVFPGYLTFFLAVMLGNLGNNIYLPAMQAYLGDRTPYAKRGFVIGLTELSWGLSFILLVPLAGLLMEWSAWYMPYVALSAATVLLILLVLKFIPADAPDTTEPLAIFTDIRKVLAYAPAIFGLLTGALFIMGNEQVSVVFSLWIRDSYGLQLAALGAASMVIGFSELGGEGVAALFADRLGKERIIGLSLALNALWVISLPWLGKTPTGGFIWLFFFYLTFEVAIISIIPLVTEITPATRATMISLFIAALSIGRALGDVLAPVLFKGGFMLNAGVCAGLDVLALLTLSRIRMPKAA